MGLVLSTVAGVIIRETGFDLMIQSAVVLVGMALMIGFAILLDWQVRMSKRDMPVVVAVLPPASSPGPAAPLAKVLAEPSTK